MGKYRKAVVAVLGAMVTTAQTTLPLPPIWHAWLTVVLAGLTAAGVWAVENDPMEPARPSEPRHQL